MTFLWVSSEIGEIELETCKNSIAGLYFLVQINSFITGRLNPTPITMKFFLDATLILKTRFRLHLGVLFPLKKAETM